MALTAAGKNIALDAWRASAAFAGLFDAGTPLTAVTGVTSTDTFTKTAHGLANGTVVLLSGLTGGANLVAGRVYFVIGTATNTFQISTSSGGSATDFGTDVTSVTVTPYIEISGGSPAYARKAIAYAAASDGAVDDSTNGAVFDIPAGATVDAEGDFTALTAGTLLGFEVVTPEAFAGQGTYTLTDRKVNLNGGA